MSSKDPDIRKSIKRAATQQAASQESARRQNQEPETRVQFTRSEIRIFLLVGIIVGMIIIAVTVTAVFRQQFTTSFLAVEGISLLENVRPYGSATLEGEIAQESDPETGRIRLTAIYSSVEELPSTRILAYCGNLSWGPAWTMVECSPMEDDPMRYRIVLLRNN